MKKIALLPAIIAFMFSSCSDRVKATDSDSDDADADSLTVNRDSLEDQNPEESQSKAIFDTLAFEQMVNTEILPIIPDHGIDNLQKFRKFTTPELASLLEEAYDLPTMSPEEIGDEEFLYYFVTGNDGAEGSGNARSTLKSLTSIPEYRAVVSSNYYGQDHTLMLVKVGNIWKLDDFDGQKSKVRDYVKKAREFFKSGQYRNVEYPSETYFEEVARYLKKYNP